MTRDMTQAPRLNVVAVASSEDARARLYAQLQDLDFVAFDGVCIELSDAVAKCHAKHGPLPDVLIVDLTGRELDGSLFIEAIGMNPQNPCVIFALHHEMDLDVFKEAIRRGAKEFIQYPEDMNGLKVALQKHAALMAKMSVQNTGSPSAQSQVKPSEQGELIVAFAAKGGAGCSTIVANTAFEMTQLGKKVVVMDLDQFYCNSEVSLAIRPEYAISDLVNNNPQDVDAALVDKITFKHPDGLHMVVGCKSVLDDNEMISPELLEVVLNHLLASYDVVMADLPTHALDPYHQYMVERSDKLLLVSGSDIPSLYRTRQYLDLAQKYLDTQKIKLVLNRYNLKAAYGISNQELESKFRFDIFARIANDWDLNVEANSVGTAMGRLNPKSEIAKGYQKLAKLLMEEKGDAIAEETSAKPAGLLKKLFPGKPASSRGGQAHVIQ